MYCYYVSMYYLKDTYLIILNVFFYNLLGHVKDITVAKVKELFLRLVILAPDISARDISGQTFNHGNFSAREYFDMGIFRHHGRFGTGMLWNWDILAQRYFSTWTFWHMYILALCKAIYTFRHSAEISMCQNVHVPQCPSLVRSPCRNIHGAKKYPCTNVLAQIIPCLSYYPAGIMVISMRNTRVKQFL